MKKDAGTADTDTPMIKETYVQVPTIIVNMEQYVSVPIEQSFRCMGSWREELRCARHTDCVIVY